MSSLAQLAARVAAPELTLVGLMSGTSADGIDAVVVRVAGTAPELRVHLLASCTTRYSDDVRERVLAARGARAEEVARLDAELGEAFARAALRVVAQAELAPADVVAIGSHGQTIAHAPGAGAPGPGGRVGAATLQIGSAARIAERTGIDVVSDFRARDVAAGGEGAPLVPFVDWALFRLPDALRLAQNLGGVGNVTLITPLAADVRAFDTGPANGPIDAAVSILSSGRLRHDEGGESAARGTVDHDEVERLLAAPWFRSPPPRSLSRETFGDALVGPFLLRREDLAPDDAIATLTEFVARSVVDAYREHLPIAAHGLAVRDVLVSGGGVHNAHLMQRLAALLDPIPVYSTSAVGVDPDQKEAIAFAVLAGETLRGRAGNLPQVTGAAGPRVLGSLTLA